MTTTTRPILQPGSATLRTFHVLDPEARIGAREGRMLVETGGEAHAIVITDLHEVIVHGRAHLSSGARTLLLEAGIDVVFVDGRGRLMGRMHAHRQANVGRRLAQLEVLAQPERRLALAKRIVTEKLDAQLEALRPASRNAEARAARADIAHVRDRIGDAPDLDTLRGLEGQAAARGFDAFAARLRAPGLPWTRRARRPATDIPNAALNYAYALAKSAVEREVLLASLDPHVGVLHASTRGTAALVLDLVEVLRPTVDTMVLGLLNQRQLTAAHGETDEDGAVTLTADGRRTLVAAWRETLAAKAPHPETGHAWARADLVREHVAAYRRALMPDEATTASDAEAA